MERPLYHSSEEGSQETARRSEPRYRSQPADHQVRGVLQAVLEVGIIPRLMNAHRSPLLPASQVGAERAIPRSVEASHVQTLVDISLHGEAGRVRDFVVGLRDEGISVERLYLDLVTPAARRIGAMWEADTCDFVLVTLALLRIQQVVYDFSPEFIEGGAEPSSRRVLVSPMPGSHHTLGAAMVADFFRRDGWDVFSTHDLSRADLLRSVRREWFDVVALSISAPIQLVSSTTLIADIRKLSSNKGILILVGGPLAQSVPDLATRVGADEVMLDAMEAVEFAGRAVPARRVTAAG